MEEPGAGYCPWGCKESDTTERFHFTSALALPPMSESILYFTDTTPGVVLWLQKGWTAFGYFLFQLLALI